MNLNDIDLNDIARRQHDWVERMGWHNKTVLESLALIASEIGEAAAECLGDEPTFAYGEELADIVLRTADLAYANGIDLAKTVSAAQVTWIDTSPRGAFAELMVDMAHWLNTARSAELDERFAQAMGRVLRRVLDMAARAGVALDAQVKHKMAINETRGTRGRRI